MRAPAILLAVTLVIPFVGASSARAALVNHWAFDEAGGATTATDTGAGGNHGTVSGATTGVTGVLGNAYSFNGIDDYVEMVGYKGIAGKTSRTVSLWVNTDGTGAGSPSSSRSLIGWGGPAGTNGALWAVGLNKNSPGNGTLNATRVSVIGGYATGNPSLATSTWKLVTVTLFDDTSPNVSETIFYVNGAQKTISTTGGKGVTTGSTWDVILGIYPNPADRTNNGPYKGLMDDVAIWNESLTAGMVQGLYDVAVVNVGGSALGYDAGRFSQLKAVFEAQSGSVTFGELTWQYATDLGNTAGLSLSGSDYRLVLDALAGTGLLATLAALAGDTNGDRVVDAADFINLKKNFNQPGGVAEGNFGTDGLVDWTDLAALTANFGRGGPSSVVPEPCSAMLLTFGAALLRRRRARHS